ncbi:dynein axonemal assembly factor 6 [Neodiprion pinetum]|uniref:Dynein axonemal assembly factor 6 n=1 Tax=Neodiprion lecontei TaxID=441921 RepID=A0A6J0BYE3_NEOLC|nr:dynein axonemal assembly factor 6 [Neodiprion lecontei]XP_046470000.1 dynein axonemal assembly factor 6 [Neodiprion pinetum]XP_046470001.1 dynein axonemal assembly factor 6 [Neodiprion pinetum]XP_046607583.1 dynein axonemal assembly factor 6 [Neodiprion virginianus]XP_046607584.1 dynein axonemal assembly factor 6 [Neodiprion virginianus]
MDGCFSFNDIKSLQQLIAPPTNNDSDSEDDLPQAGARKLGPGDIGKRESGNLEHSGPHAALKGEGDNIWHSSEVAAAPAAAEIFDPREVPEYEMKFKQAVSTEDVFLGMNGKTPGTASCEWLTVIVKLPGEPREKVELSVESELIDIRSPRYRLHLPTPHTTDPHNSTAKWHTDSSTLEITLKLTREMDLINF